MHYLFLAYNQISDLYKKKFNAPVEEKWKIILTIKKSEVLKRAYNDFQNGVFDTDQLSKWQLGYFAKNFCIFGFDFDEPVELNCYLEPHHFRARRKIILGISKIYNIPAKLD